MELSEQALKSILNDYGIEHPVLLFLRHNENRTYKVTDSSTGSVYLLRIHHPITENMVGLQHTREGLRSELQLLADPCRANLSYRADACPQPFRGVHFRNGIWSKYVILFAAPLDRRTRA